MNPEEELPEIPFPQIASELLVNQELLRRERIRQEERYLREPMLRHTATSNNSLSSVNFSILSPHVRALGLDVAEEVEAVEEEEEDDPDDTEQTADVPDPLQPSDRIGYREYTRKPTFQSTEPGSIIRTTRKFGVEIECYTKTSSLRDAVTGALPNGVGIGTDGSIRESYGVEVRLPIASGKRGEALVEHTCKVLQEHKFDVSESCGLHVHFDMKDFMSTVKDSQHDSYDLHQQALRVQTAEKWMASLKAGDWNPRSGLGHGDIHQSLVETYWHYWMQKEFTPTILRGIATDTRWDKVIGSAELRSAPTTNAEMKRLAALKYLLALYITFDDVLLSFLPLSRRGNSYCQPIRSYWSLAEIMAARSFQDIERMWYRLPPDGITSAKRNVKHSSRRKGVNLASFFAEGHMEIRYHSGTLNAKKILYWIDLHQSFIRKAKEGDNIENLRGLHTMLDLREKAESLFDILHLTADSAAYFRARQDKFAKQQFEVAILEDKEKPETCVV